MQPFTNPKRDFVIRATAVDTPWSLTSEPFCRLAPDAPQPPIISSRVNAAGDFLVNDKPWVPWGVTYGHNPVYDGPADGAKPHDLANLKPWGLYDRYGGNLADRALWDGNCVRHVEGGGIVPPAKLDELWKMNLYASTVFLPPGKPWPADHLAFLRTAPMVAAVSRGPEEAFGHFLPMTPQQLAAVKAEVESLRAATGKPVMVGHGGYWARLEFETVPFFDVYGPETEPWYPAPVHTDLAPLAAGTPSSGTCSRSSARPRSRRPCGSARASSTSCGGWGIGRSSSPPTRPSSAVTTRCRSGSCGRSTGRGGRGGRLGQVLVERGLPGPPAVLPPAVPGQRDQPGRRRRAPPPRPGHPVPVQPDPGAAFAPAGQTAGRRTTNSLPRQCVYVCRADLGQDAPGRSRPTGMVRHPRPPARGADFEPECGHVREPAPVCKRSSPASHFTCGAASSGQSRG